MENHSSIPIDTIDQIESLLRGISDHINRKGREILTDFSITLPQFGALVWLKKEGDLTIGELGQRMFLACSTMSDLIDRMEKAQLVTRIRDQKDRRVVRIQLLERGKEVIQQVILARQSYLTEVLSLLSKEEAEEISHQLSFLYQQMTRN